MLHDARSESYCRQTTEAGLTSTTHEWADHIQFSYRRETNRTKLTRVCLGSVFLRASFDSTQPSLVKHVKTVNTGRVLSRWRQQFGRVRPRLFVSAREARTRR